MTQKGYIIPHTHWDREWRYPLWENRMYLVELIDELLEILDTDPEYQSFLFDGQTVSLYDYLEVRPENEKRLKKHIVDGRILVGPWYTLPDLYPVSGESLIRNLLKGIRSAKQLGKCLQTGYESFGWGQISQFPQIYRGFQIDTVFIAKNVDKSRAKHCEFLWRGADGSTVLATRLGEDARANFFMNATLQIMNGMPYKSDEYRYRNGKQGMVYHQADIANHIQDYFLMEHHQEIRCANVLEPFMKAWDGMKDTLIPDHRALMDGSDSTTAQPFLTTMIHTVNEELEKSNRGIRVESSSIEKYVELLHTIPKENLTVIEGELRDGPATALSANALMTRPVIKILNKKVQNALYRCAEPFSVAADSMGYRYDTGFLGKAMDYLLLSHPHDSINGVTQDKTVDDVMYRLNQALELSGVVYNQVCKKILLNINTEQFSEEDILLAVFNPLPVEVSDVLLVSVDTPAEKCIWDFTLEEADGTVHIPQLLSRKETVIPVSDMHARPWPYYADRHQFYFDASRIPAGGYKIYKLNPQNTFNRNAEYWPLTRKTRGRELSQSDNEMENEFLHVTINSNGSVTVFDKENQKKYGNLNYFEDEGDCGDYWIYYPPYHNKIYNSTGLQAEIWKEENNELSCTFASKVTMKVPAYALRPLNGVKGESRRSDEFSEITVISYYTLKKNDRKVEVRLVVNNTASDHRFRVLFDTQIQGKSAYAEGHFTVDERAYTPLQDLDGNYYNELTTQPMQNFVDITDGENGLGIVTDSIIEYEARNNTAGTLALTLFRSVRNIICTEMRSGGHFPEQKGGQSLGKLEYRYAICPHNGLYEEGQLYEKANRFAVPLKAVQTCKQKNKGSLPEEYSFYKLSKGLEMSALKKCEDGDEYLLRIYNPYHEEKTGEFEFALPVTSAKFTNLNEEVLGLADVQNNKIMLKVPPQKIITIQFSVVEGA